MTRAELAAELLRIYDLVVAEPAPNTDSQWWHIVESCIGLHKKADEARAEWSRSRPPQPRMVDGIGLCTSSCHALHPATTGVGRKVMGKCALSGTRTSCGVPCRPWMDKALQRYQDVGDTQAGQSVAVPCEHVYSTEQCGNMTICRDTLGSPRCRAHGGQPGQMTR